MESTSLFFLLLLLSFQLATVVSLLSKLIYQKKSSIQVNRISDPLIMSLSAKHFDGLIFDCDGVIAETERDVHRETFNKAFQSKGYDVLWDVELYGELLKVGGGKERITSYFNKFGWPSKISESQQQEAVKELHQLKTKLFQSLIESGAISPRPGITRLIDEAIDCGVKLAICSTSNEAAVQTIARVLLGEKRLSYFQIFAGDVVAKKKPSPDVYNLASETLKLNPNRCWVIEDSAIGLQAAKAAGMRCLITKSVYTAEEDFSSADVVVNDLDQGLDGPVSIAYLDYKASPIAYRPPKLSENAEMFSASRDMATMFKKIANGEGGLPFGG